MEIQIMGINSKIKSSLSRLMLRHDCEQLAKEKSDQLHSCPLCPHTSRSEKVLEKHYEEEHEDIKK